MILCGLFDTEMTISSTLQYNRIGSEADHWNAGEFVMVKFLQSIGDKMLELLESEAKKRDVTVQKLVRAIIITD